MSTRFRPPLRFTLHRLLAIAGAAVVLLLTVLAASPEWHAWVHPDAGQSGHECAVTLFLHGIDAAALVVAVVVAPRLRPFGVTVPVPGPRVASPRFWLLPGRAPPAS